LATKLGEAFVELTTKDSLDKGLAAAKSKVNGFLTNLAQGVAQGLGQALFNATTRAVGAAVDEIGKATRAASDLNETLSKTTTVFGDASAEVLAWSKNSATAYGLSQKAALEATASLGNMFIQLGENREQAAGMSSLMVELAADIASFNNVAGGAEEVLQDMSSAFRGEYDPIQKYIPIINAAAVEQQALAETGKSAAKELTALEKAVAAQTLIMQGAGVAAGDFARTLGNVANQERILAAQMENFRATLGQAFTPIYGEILRGLNLLIGQVSEHGEGIVQALATGLVNGVIYILPALRTIRDVISYWLKPGSPPRLLPDIDKWMTETINVWLSGASKADFGILRDLGSSIEGILRSYAGTGQIKETDLVARIFGSQAAILRAIAEWRALGQVTQGTLEAIRRSAGPAGDAVGDLVQGYFDLERASRNATKAQEDLNRVTGYYDRLLSPLDSKLRGLQERQEDIRDAERKAELGQTLRDPNSSQAAKRLARLEIEEIELRDRMQGIQEERDVKVKAEQDKLNAAKKAEDAARERLDRQQASLEQQIKTNSLITEEINLRERLATEALAEQEKALRELEAAQREAERAQKEAQAEAQRHAAQLEQLYQAQLQYNLTVADTPGKIGLLRLELTRYNKDQEEYWRILGQIHTLEEQRKKEMEAGGGGGLLPPILPAVEGLDIPSWSKDLATKLRREIDKAFGEQPDFGISIKGGSSILNRIIGPEPEKLPQVSQDVKNFVGAIENLTTAITNLNLILSGDGTEIVNTWADNTVEKMEDTAEKSGRALTGWENDTRLHIRMMQGYMDNGWAGVWKAYQANMGQGIADANVDAVKKWTVLRNMLPSGENGEPVASDSPLTNLAVAGAAITANIASGMASRWLTGLLPGFVVNLLSLRNLLPGSEPKDTSSPLYGLSDAGSAIVDNIWQGLKDKWKEFSEWWGEKWGEFLDMIPELPSWMGGGSITPQSYNAPGYNSGGSIGAASVALAPVSVAGLPSMGPTTNNATNNNTYGPINLFFTGPVTKQQATQAANDIQTELRRRGAPT
jgi:hypothetical protein